MARYKDRLITKRPKPPGDAVEQGLVISFGKIGAPNAAGKKHISDKGTLEFFGIKNDMPRCVSGTMPHQPLMGA